MKRHRRMLLCVTATSMAAVASCNEPETQPVGTTTPHNPTSTTSTEAAEAGAAGAAPADAADAATPVHTPQRIDAGYFPDRVGTTAVAPDDFGPPMVGTTARVPDRKK